jgi:hypothetical protein
VGAAEEVDLLAAVDDLPIREKGFLGYARKRPFWIAVEG